MAAGCPSSRCRADALLYGESGRHFYQLRAWVIMPNHVHVLLLPKTSLPVIMRWLKGSTARQAQPDSWPNRGGLLGGVQREAGAFACRPRARPRPGTGIRCQASAYHNWSDRLRNVETPLPAASGS
ncbi:MAG: transposase [Bryobacteraceae bacterium]